MLRNLLLAGLMNLALGASANPGLSADDFEALAARTPWKNENGRETRTFELPGGIVIVQQRRGESISTMGIDDSGGAAVLCLAQILMAVQAEEEMCPSRDEEWRQEIGSALDRVHAFVAANSLTPITREAVVAEANKTVARLKEEIRRVHGRSGDSADLCRAVAQDGLGRGIKRQGIEAFRADLDKALAVPRLPVMNPCL